MIWIVAILTMAVGSVLALAQTDIKRMLAYSSIAHAGFLLVGFVGLHQTRRRRDLLAAGGAVLPGHLRLHDRRRLRRSSRWSATPAARPTHLSRWAGLGKESPLVAGVFAFFLLAMAGIPLTSGFTGKWAVFTSAAQGGAWPLVVVAVVLSAVAAFFYVRVIVLMYFSDPVGEGPTVAMPSVLTTMVIARRPRSHRGARDRPRSGPRPRRDRPERSSADAGGDRNDVPGASPHDRHQRRPGCQRASPPACCPRWRSRSSTRRSPSAWCARMAEVEERLEREITSEADFITEACRHLLHAGGKRIRPLLVLLAAEAGGGTPADAGTTRS